jgi:hypothetical protein
LLLTVIRAVFCGTFWSRIKHPAHDAATTKAVIAAATNRLLTGHLHPQSRMVTIWLWSHRFFYQPCGRLRD